MHGCGRKGVGSSTAGEGERKASTRDFTGVGRNTSRHARAVTHVARRTSGQSQLVRTKHLRSGHEAHGTRVGRYVALNIYRIYNTEVILP